MMNRTKCLEVLKRLITDEIVISSYSTATEWVGMTDRPLNYFSHGAMGLCSSHGLGMALAMPHKRVIVFDGDGSLLMNLGTLVTISAAAPKNLVHLCFHNGSYEANGGHPLPKRDVDFTGMARSAGIKHVHTIDDFRNFEQQIGGILKQEGPVFADLLIEQGTIRAGNYDDMYKPERRQKMREALKAGG